MQIDNLGKALSSEFRNNLGNVLFDGPDLVDVRIGRYNAGETRFGKEMDLRTDLFTEAADDRACQHDVTNRRKAND